MHRRLVTCGHDWDIWIFARVDTNTPFGLLMAKDLDIGEYTRVKWRGLLQATDDNMVQAFTYNARLWQQHILQPSFPLLFLSPSLSPSVPSLQPSHCSSPVPLFIPIPVHKTITGKYDGDYCLCTHSPTYTGNWWPVDMTILQCPNICWNWKGQLKWIQCCCHSNRWL